MYIQYIHVVCIQCTCSKACTYFMLCYVHAVHCKCVCFVLHCSAVRPELADKLRGLVSLHGPLPPKTVPGALPMPTHVCT